MQTRASTSASAQRNRPDVVYRHSWIDFTVKDSTTLIFDVHELLHLQYAADRIIKTLPGIIDAAKAKGAVFDNPSAQSVCDSRVKVYRRTNTPGEEPYVDWRIPTAKLAAPQIMSTVELDELRVMLTDSYAELAEIYAACVDYGNDIDLAVRRAAGIPDHITAYRAQSTSGAAGWKFESRLERTVTIDYYTLP